MAVWKLSIMAYIFVNLLPLVTYYTVCMQLHGKTIVWLHLYMLETIVRKSYSKIISESDISSMSMRY